MHGKARVTRSAADVRSPLLFTIAGIAVVAIVAAVALSRRGDAPRNGDAAAGLDTLRAMAADSPRADLPAAAGTDTPPASRPVPEPVPAATDSPPRPDSAPPIRPQIDSGRIDRPDVTLPRPGGVVGAGRVAAAPEARAREALAGIRDSLDLGTRRPALRARAGEIYGVASFSPQLRAEAAGLAGRAYLQDGMNDDARDWIRRAMALDPRPAYARLLDSIPD